jgi:IS1 family transposase
VWDVVSTKVQCDEIWSFVYAKQKNVPDNMKRTAGDVWTWVGIDADTKFVISWFVGNRNAESANIFMQDIAQRLANKVQLTTDGLKAYLKAVDNAFEGKIDFAQLVKMYGESETVKDKKYSPADCIGTSKRVITGHPSRKHISTSYIERQNLTMRMHMRRFTRLTNAFSKKMENYSHAIALHFLYYNFCKIHQTLRVTPAMEAGLTNKLWEIQDIVGLIDKNK